VIVWRIAAETRKYSADDLSGGGAAANPGRWNDDGQAVVYAAESRAVAALETVAHVDDGGLPLTRFLVHIEVPDAAWSARDALDEITLSATAPNWDAIPGGHASVSIGAEWLRAKRSLVLTVPSVIIPEECIVLLNPGHLDASKLKPKIVRRFDFARVLRPSATR